MKVWIDPGHGGTDSGALHASGRTEKEDNLRYAFELRRQFQAQGWEVVMTREDDRTIGINERCAQEVREHCDLALSCHRNGGVPSANGFETWVLSTAPASFVTWGNDIADKVAALGMRKRGSFKGTPAGKGYADFGVNRLTRSPSMLIELGFVSSDQDNAVFDEKLPELCEAIVRGCCRFKGVSYREPESSPAPGLEAKTVTLTQAAELLRAAGVVRIEL